MVSPRNHPLLRLFDEESNPYAQASSNFGGTTITLPSGPVNTVKPTISLPSFDDLEDNDHTANSSGGFDASQYAWSSEAATSGFGFGGAASSAFVSADNYSGYGFGGSASSFGLPSSTSAFGFGGALGAAEDLMSPLMIRDDDQYPPFQAGPSSSSSQSAAAPRFGWGFGQGGTGSFGAGSGSGFAFGSGSGSAVQLEQRQQQQQQQQQTAHSRSGSQTPTETTFAEAAAAGSALGGGGSAFVFPAHPQQQQYPVANSPSLPSLGPPSSSASGQLNRPFGAAAAISPAANANVTVMSGPPPVGPSRRRADTAPSRAPYDPPIDAFAPYPPLGQGLPRVAAPGVAAASPSPSSLSASTPPSGATPAPYPPLGPGLPRRTTEPTQQQQPMRLAMGHRTRTSGSSSRDFSASGFSGPSSSIGGAGAAMAVARDLNRPFGAAAAAAAIGGSGGGTALRDRGWSNPASVEGQRPHFRAAAGPTFPGPPDSGGGGGGSGGGNGIGAAPHGRVRSASEATKRQALQVSEGKCLSRRKVDIGNKTKNAEFIPRWRWHRRFRRPKHSQRRVRVPPPLRRPFLLRLFPPPPPPSIHSTARLARSGPPMRIAGSRPGNTFLRIHTLRLPVRRVQVAQRSGGTRKVMIEEEAAAEIPWLLRVSIRGSSSSSSSSILRRGRQQQRAIVPVSRNRIPHRHCLLSPKGRPAPSENEDRRRDLV